jgi:hypothetical protein
LADETIPHNPGDFGGLAWLGCGLCELMILKKAGRLIRECDRAERSWLEVLQWQWRP